MCSTAAHTCVYYGCKSVRKESPDISFYKFPIKDEARCEQCKLNSGNIKLEHLDSEVLKSKLICEIHFTADNFKDAAAQKKFLTWNAVPSKYGRGSSDMDENHRTFEHENRVAGDKGFKDKTLFVTGGSGFIGKVFIEKILRSCPLVKKIYVLIRTKRGKNAKSRLDEIFAGPLFDLLKKREGSDIIKKVVPLSGDVCDIDLGLSVENRKVIASEVDFIFHLAATVRFDEPLRRSVLLNTRGTKFMLELAKECKQLKVFIHVSTAFCYPHEEILYEKAYPPPTDPHNIIKVMECLDVKTIDLITDRLLGDCPNAYTYSKSLAEAVVVSEMENLPVVIVRPSVVIPIWKEPLPGWTDNLNGPVGLMLAGGKGILRSMHCDPKGYADFIPADVFANSLALIAYTYVNYKKQRFYNIVSSSQYRYTWTYIVELGKKILESRMPLNWVVWYPSGTLTKSKLLQSIYIVLFHYIPAVILDAIIILSGNKPVLWKIQQRLTKGFDVFEYYTNNKWNFINTHSVESVKWMNATEKKIYETDGKELDEEDYVYNSIHAARLYILREGDETLPTAKRHMKIMWVVDRLSKLLILLAFGYYILWSWILRPALKAIF